MIPTDPNVLNRVEARILAGVPPIKVRVSFGMTHSEYIEFLDKHASGEVLMYMMMNNRNPQ